MKTILILFISIPIFMSSNGKGNDSDFRKSLIDELAKTEANLAQANCFCRIGDDRGSSVKEYPGALMDLGSLKKYSGLRPQSGKNEDDCGRLCAIAAEKWFNSLSTDRLCEMVKKGGSQRLLAYSKVGTKNWTVRGAGKVINCCNGGGEMVCPTGYNFDSNLKRCTKQICTADIPNSDGILLGQKKGEWGFVWNKGIYIVAPPKSTPPVWHACK